MNKKNLAILGGGLISACAIGAVVCSAMTIYMSNNVSKHLSLVQSDVTAFSKAFIKEEEKADDAQYVTIAGQYPILDTSKISDAYINKDDSQLTTPEEKETLTLASKLLSEITTDKMSLYQKELAIHDWMAKNIVYASDTLASVPTGTGATHTPYGVLKYKKAVCVGYATTFKLLMNMLGADCMVEHDNELCHSWNVVKLDDNEWYIVDNYYDSSSSSPSKVVSHTNFNLTNDYFTQDHTFNTSLYPVAAGTKYSYALQNAVEVKDVKQLPKLLSEAKNKTLTDCYYKFKTNVDSNYIAAVINGISQRMGDTVTLNGNYVTTDGSSVVLAVTFNYLTTDSSTDEAKYPDLTKELDKYFGESMNY